MWFFGKMSGVQQGSGKSGGAQLDFVSEVKDQVQLDKLDQQSYDDGGQPIVFFKHSVRCGISAMVWQRLKKDWPEQLPDCQLFYLDIINNRGLSGALAERYEVEHESPQVMVIQNGKCIFNTSHHGITAQAIAKAIHG